MRYRLFGTCLEIILSMSAWRLCAHRDLTSSEVATWFASTSCAAPAWDRYGVHAVPEPDMRPSLGPADSPPIPRSSPRPAPVCGTAANGSPRRGRFRQPGQWTGEGLGGPRPAQRQGRRIFPPLSSRIRPRITIHSRSKNCVVLRRLENLTRISGRPLDRRAWRGGRGRSLRRKRWRQAKTTR